MNDKLEQIKLIRAEMSANKWKIHRKKIGLTLRQVEEKTGISNAYLSQLETGKIKNPSFDVVMKLYELYSNPPPKSEICICPNCMSDKIEDVSPTTNNGIFGPGYSSWKIIDMMVCNNCGIYFKQLVGNGKTDSHYI